MLELAADSRLVATESEGAAPGASTAALSPASLPTPSGRPAAAVAASPMSGPASLEELRKQHILRALERCDWVIEGPRGAAHLLGMQPSPLRSRLKKLGLQQ